MNSKVIHDLNEINNKFKKYFTELELQKLLVRTFDIRAGGF